MTDPIRLSKRLIELVGCSRREAELFIEGGWVTVDGVVVDEPQFKVENQIVALSPDAKADAPEAVTLLFNVPAGMSPENAMKLIGPETLSADHSFSKRPLKGHFLRLEAISTLQANASGLMVFSQDWKILRKLTDDRSKIEQEYVVEVDGDMVPHGLNRLTHGMLYKGKELPKVKASWQNETRLRFAGKGIKPGQLLHMCRMVGLSVVSTRRIRVGRVPMASLPSGQWRYLHEYERF
jgi:23S rRNA pseudouridine2604 synthase